MTANHDTPEAVEVIVRKLTDLHFPPREAAAAMLRRLHKRAVDAERERDEARADAAHTAGQLMQDILRARADTLREAYAAMDSLPEYARHLAERRVQQLIHKEPRHD